MLPYMTAAPTIQQKAGDMGGEGEGNLCLSVLRVRKLACVASCSNVHCVGSGRNEFKIKENTQKNDEPEEQNV